jgi:hypothetical protein
MQRLALVVLLVAGPALAQADLDSLARPATPDEPTADVLKRARSLYDALEYDKVLPLVEAALAREGVPIEQRLDAYQLQGSAQAIVGDPIEAEKPFRLLLRARPDFNMPASTPPKILAVFRKVQAEENTIREETNKALRKSLVGSMAILGDDPVDREGGLPLVFRYRVRDPNSALEGARVQYRRAGEPSYSSLALKRDEEGEWRGAIPGEWTANDDGFTLEFYVETFDATGPLVLHGAPSEPLNATITPGTADRAPPPPLPLWSFLGTSATAGVVAVAGGVFTGLTVAASLDYQRQLTDSIDGDPAIGRELKSLENLGNTLMITQFALYGVAGAIALGAGVMAPFTNWSGEEEVTDF